MWPLSHSPSVYAPQSGHVPSVDCIYKSAVGIAHHAYLIFASATTMSTESTPATAKTPSAPSFQLFSLVGQTAIVTGGTRGIGAACAIALAEAVSLQLTRVPHLTGADICLIQRDESNTTTRDAIRALGRRADIAVCDLSDLEAVKTVFDRALELMGGQIHIMVNCGGIQRRAPAVEFPESYWDEVRTCVALDIELQKLDGSSHLELRARFPTVSHLGNSTIHTGDQCEPQSSMALIAGSWETHGSERTREDYQLWVTNVLSGLSPIYSSMFCFETGCMQGGITVPAYAAAKGGLGQLTKALSNEWSKHNVQVNAICPGYIATDMNEKLLADPNRLRQISERIPAGRWGEPKDFAGPTVFLASSASLYVSGELLVVDGGWMGR
ncbi:2-deoxy-D-gluconate 3-dehydrogenase, putative [Rhizoctonia solani AG-1 IA]|uniref:2-deoxy-D-gluconate 3-dehydrogenase, putative n=1 Tax=Thanatephorus cucumeris (strain AG1-IA) TaxID=983506 RepID=L8WTT8_THACA|nr:2-deoxy-D-gluconate 3-dehydrogenase, putative [Rhizoctonia solani AG-1 IA]